MNQPKCILIPIDFSEPSMEALDLGVRMACQMGARIALLTVAELPVAYRGCLYGGLPQPERL